MQRNPSILIIAYQLNTLITMKEQLIETGFDEHFDIDAMTTDELSETVFPNYSLIIFSSQAAFNIAKPYLSIESRYVISKRTVNYANIRELIEIPKGTKAYLFSDLEIVAEETVRNLNETGIALNFVPSFPGKEIIGEIDIAVTCGEPQLVPSNAIRVIDIGCRIIDISTLIEIYNQFHISPNSSKSHLSARFVQSLVDLTSDLTNEIFTSKLLRRSLESIVNNMDDAVLVYDVTGICTIMNPKALNLLNLSNSKTPFTLSAQILTTISDLPIDEDHFIELEGIPLYFRKKKIEINQKVYAFLAIFRKLDEIQKIEHEYRNKAKTKNFIAKHTFSEMKTENGSFLDMIKMAKKLAKSHSTILIMGETGTGKEVLAQSIHNESLRKLQPFVAANFAAISESLIESELFGYEGGAFTGAKKSGHIGMFEQAHNGTIFLDEIGDASPVIQNRLLRVLQEKQIMRVGGERVISLDVRVIAATNKNFHQLINEGKFREDLFYRLNVLPLQLMPLRERKEDILLLIKLFTKEFTGILNRTPFQYSDEALRELTSYDWPGNVRELRNCVEFLAHICEDVVYKEDLPFWKGFSREQSIDQLAFEHIRSQYKEKGFLQELLIILDYLASKYVQSAGRQFLLELLAEKGLSLSDQQLRYRLSQLNKDGFIISEKGRKGSSITGVGKRFLEYCLTSV